VAEHLRPVQEKYAKIAADKAYLEQTYRAGAEKAKNLSKRTLAKVYKKVGLMDN